MTITGAGGGGDYTWWQPLGLDTGTGQVFTKEDKAINDKPLRGVLSLVFFCVFINMGDEHCDTVCVLSRIF